MQPLLRQLLKSVSNQHGFAMQPISLQHKACNHLSYDDISYATPLRKKAFCDATQCCAAHDVLTVHVSQKCLEVAKTILRTFCALTKKCCVGWEIAVNVSTFSIYWGWPSYSPSVPGATSHFSHRCQWQGFFLDWHRSETMFSCYWRWTNKKEQKRSAKLWAHDKVNAMFIVLPQCLCQFGFKQGEHA